MTVLCYVKVCSVYSYIHYHVMLGQLNICAMKEKSPGVYTRGKAPVIEVKARKGDNYETICKKAANACGLVETTSKELCLFRFNGVRILNQDITGSSGNHKEWTREWTIANYLTALKKSPGNVKFGIGFIESLSTEGVAMSVYVLVCVCVRVRTETCTEKYVSNYVSATFHCDQYSKAYDHNYLLKCIHASVHSIVVL